MELKNELKDIIVKTLRLEIKPEEIEDKEPLFGDSRLGLDSIDALELIIAFEKSYGIKIAEDIDGEKVFASIDSIAAYIKGVKGEIIEENTKIKSL